MLDSNPAALLPDGLQDIEVTETIKDGRAIYRAA